MTIDWDNCPSNTSFLERETDPEKTELTEAEDATDQLRNALEQAYTKDKLSKQVQFNAVCLKKLKEESADSGVVRIKARIPELHSLIPEPRNENDHATMSMYPTFIALQNSFKDGVGPSTESVPPGSILLVTFGNMSNFSQPRVLEIGNIAGSNARTSSGGGGGGGSGGGSGGGGGGTGGGTGRGGAGTGGKLASIQVDDYKYNGTVQTYTDKKGKKRTRIIVVKNNPFLEITMNSKKNSLSGLVKSDFEKVLKEVHELGGYFFTAGWNRGLNAQITESRAVASWHYTAMAVDIDTGHAMGIKMDVDKSPYVVVPDGSRHWTVWAKVMNTDTATAPKHASVTDVELNAWVWQSGKGGKTQKVTGQYFNLTEIMKRNNFGRIGRRSKWKTSYMSTEWWHFQNTSHVPQGTDWHEIIKKAKSIDEAGIKNTKYGQTPSVAGHTNPLLVKSGKSPWDYTKGWKLKGDNFS